MANDLIVPGNYKLTTEQETVVRKHMMGGNLRGASLVPKRMPILRLQHKGSDAGLITHSFDPTKKYDTFRGVLIKERARRAWWAGAYKQGESSPPDCRSWDGIHVCTNPQTAKEKPGGTNPQCPKDGLCKSCPKSQWTPGPDGKDIPPVCCLVHDLILWHEDQYVAQMPHNPKSLKHINSYINQIEQSPSASYFNWSLFMTEDEDGTFVIKPMFLGDEPFEDWMKLWPLIADDEIGYTDDTDEADLEQATSEVKTDVEVTTPTQETATPSESPKGTITRKPKENFKEKPAVVDTTPETTPQTTPQTTPAKPAGKKAGKAKPAATKTAEIVDTPSDNASAEVAIKVNATPEKIQVEQPTQETAVASEPAAADDDVCPW